MKHALFSDRCEFELSRVSFHKEFKYVNIDTKSLMRRIICLLGTNELSYCKMVLEDMLLFNTQNLDGSDVVDRLYEDYDITVGTIEAFDTLMEIDLLLRSILGPYRVKYTLPCLWLNEHELILIQGEI